MTHDEINKALHEARGLCWHEWTYIPDKERAAFAIERCSFCDEWRIQLYKNSDYCNDLNAMAEVEAKFTDSQLDLYEREILIINLGGMPWAEYLRVPPEVRAKAALEVLTSDRITQK